MPALLIVLASIGDKYFSRATQRGQALIPYPDRMLRPELKRNLDMHLSFLDVDFMGEK